MGTDCILDQFKEAKILVHGHPLGRMSEGEGWSSAPGAVGLPGMTFSERHTRAKKK